MSTSFERGSLPRIPTPPVTSFRYREMPVALPSLPRIKAMAPMPEPEPPVRAEVEMTNAELQTLLAEARTAGAAEAEARLRGVLRQQVEAEAARITDALAGFERECKGYFTRVEGEVVRLALSIAAKILHRESQVDPMLVAALVQIAIGQLKENTAVQLRVHPDQSARWRAHLEASPQWSTVTLLEDAELEPSDCYLQTELGAANFSLQAQLKEVEQGFFDVLAQTPRG